MDVIRFSIEKPVTVVVGVLLVLMFGLLGLNRMPYQLSPTVTEPEITVTTTWPGATPYEIERDIIEEQESVLKGIPGLTEMESTSFNGQGQITLRFAIGTDVDNALLRVSNKMGEVRSYPENVEKPVISATGSATDPVIWMILKTDGENPAPVSTYRTFFEDEIRQHLERVKGVADLFVGGGTKKEMHVAVRPERLAAYGLTANELMSVLRSENINVSAGTMGVGRREFRVRTVGELKSPEEIGNIVLRSTGQRRITLSDVADVSFGFEKRTVAMMHNAKEGIAIGIKPEAGANVLELTDRVEETVKWLNAEKLGPKDIHLQWVYDQRPYILGAIDLLKENILIGGAFAILVLVVFLRSFSSTVVAASAIPISIVGTFIFLAALGRTLNVVSLAGIAFAVGMLVDNAIVVLENIDRHRKMGKPPSASAYEGAKEVWGAVLASTLTTVAVFLPIVFMKDVSGQLFRDIAVAISSAVVLSLFVSISVIPMFARKLYGISGEKGKTRGVFLQGLGGRFSSAIMTAVGATLKSWPRRLLTVAGLTGISALVVVVIFPKMEYLPQGNRNLVVNILVPPPGLSYEERQEIGKFIFESAKPHFGKEVEGYPGIENMFYVGAEQIMLFGAISTDEKRAGDLVPLFTGIIHKIPGMFGISLQAGIFQTRLGRGRTIDVDISGSEMTRMVQAAGAMFGAINKEMPDAQIRPVPSLEILYPEARIIPRRDRLKAAGLSSEELGILLDVLMDGRKVGEFKEEGQKKIDLVLKASEEALSAPDTLYETLVALPGGKVVPVSSLSELLRTTGITEIRHLERQRTITLQVTPPLRIPLQGAMEIIDSKVMGPMKGTGLLAGLDVKMSGAADKLTETRVALQWNFVLAALIAYLLMSALFENFLYPLIIMFTVPLAGAGGFIGLGVVNGLIAPSPLDVVTMLGFVILVGVVVNNAILIVHQSLNNVRDYGMEGKEAVLESVRTRLRPIFMSMTTTVFGLIPLVVRPGPGSELYRGLGGVILGGLAFSTVFTVFVIPALLLFFIKMENVKKPEA